MGYFEEATVREYRSRIETLEKELEFQKYVETLLIEYIKGLKEEEHGSDT